MPNATIFPLISNLPDPKSLAVKAAVEKVAALDTPVLLWGETGSGKDFWAAVLAASSPFQPLLNLGCGDVPETLLESEWFGYQKGAFSGADRDYAGKWRQAANGTIFLNQIDLLSLNMQAKLLRVIERKKVFPLGANVEADIGGRFLFSADSAIEDKVRRGEFRADLFYRISTVSIFIPPLRERKNDILPLLRHFCVQKGVPFALGEASRRRLLQYPWPGNIRELENFVSGLAVRGCALDEQGAWSLLDRPGPILAFIQSGERSLAEVEAEYIAYLLRKYRNKSQVARLLNISRKSLYNKLKPHEGH
jgi:transcriptional regulator with PAS, ATPase and Fis domain